MFWSWFNQNFTNNEEITVERRVMSHVSVVCYVMVCCSDTATNTTVTVMPTTCDVTVTSRVDFGATVNRSTPDSGLVTVCQRRESLERNHLSRTRITQFLSTVSILHAAVRVSSHARKKETHQITYV